MIKVDPATTARFDFHQFILGAVAPRPIAFVSTVDKDGNPNLAPYSFFNAFSANPPILVFSSNRKTTDNETKDTLANVKESSEVVINVVNYAIIRQMSVASVQFPKGVSEFTKSGLTPISSDLVKPFRVAESPVHMECKVKEIITLGEQGGAGHLIICDLLRMHIDENVLDDRGRIDPHKLDLVGRMGRSYYVRASGNAIISVVQAIEGMVIGFEQLPSSIRLSNVFTGNNLGQLAGLTFIPDKAETLALTKTDLRVQDILESQNPIEGLHHYAKEILDSDDSRREWAAKIAWLPEWL
jgi:flavin reductase (DIM6/NTAB) family NADH-FMN oxidoreductase RutF